MTSKISQTKGAAKTSFKVGHFRTRQGSVAVDINAPAVGHYELIRALPSVNSNRDGAIHAHPSSLSCIIASLFGYFESLQV